MRIPARADDASRGGSQLPESRVVLLLIDVINPMNFAGAEALFEFALPAARRIQSLKEKISALDFATIYVNDNFNCWHLGFRELIDSFKTQKVPGLPLIELLEPQPERDYYILKPSHSGFFRTGLEVLLERLGARTLILTGFAGDICVLFTANDAYMRDFQVVVPCDCIASERPESNDHALAQMERLLKADPCSSESLDETRLRALQEERGSGG